MRLASRSKERRGGQGHSSMPHPSWHRCWTSSLTLNGPDTSLRKGQLGAVILGLAFTWLSTRTSSKHTVSSTPHCPTLNREEPGGWISWYLENSESCLQVSGDSVSPFCAPPHRLSFFPYTHPRQVLKVGVRMRVGTLTLFESRTQRKRDSMLKAVRRRDGQSPPSLPEATWRRESGIVLPHPTYALVHKLYKYDVGRF